MKLIDYHSFIATIHAELLIIHIYFFLFVHSYDFRQILEYLFLMALLSLHILDLDDSRISIICLCHNIVKRVYLIRRFVRELLQERVVLGQFETLDIILGINGDILRYTTLAYLCCFYIFLKSFIATKFNQVLYLQLSKVLICLNEIRTHLLI